MEDMEKKIEKVLAAHRLTKEDLTAKELEELKDEIKARESGLMILDGVLANPELRFRKDKRLWEGTQEN